MSSKGFYCQRARDLSTFPLNYDTCFDEKETCWLSLVVNMQYALILIIITPPKLVLFPFWGGGGQNLHVSCKDTVNVLSSLTLNCPGFVTCWGGVQFPPPSNVASLSPYLVELENKRWSKTESSLYCTSRSRTCFLSSLSYIVLETEEHLGYLA